MTYFADVLGEAAVQRQRTTTQAGEGDVSPLKTIKDRVQIYRDLAELSLHDTKERLAVAEAELKSSEADAVQWYDAQIAPRDNGQPSLFSETMKGILELPTSVATGAEGDRISHIAKYQQYTDYRAKLSRVPGVAQSDLGLIDDALTTAQVGIFGGSDNEAQKAWQEFKDFSQGPARRAAIKGVYESTAELLKNSKLSPGERGASLVDLAQKAVEAGDSDLSTKLLAEAFDAAGEDIDVLRPTTEQLEKAVETYTKLAVRAGEGDLTETELKDYAKAKVVLEAGKFSMGSITFGGGADATTTAGQRSEIMANENRALEVTIGPSTPKVMVSVGDLYMAAEGAPSENTKKVIEAMKKDPMLIEKVARGLLTRGLSLSTSTKLVTGAIAGRGYGVERREPTLTEVIDYAKTMFPEASWSDLTPAQRKQAREALAEETF